MIHVGVGHSQDLSTADAAEHATLMAMGNAGIAKAGFNSCVRVFFIPMGHVDKTTRL